MGREELLRQKKEKEAAIKKISEEYKAPPSSVKYDLFDDTGVKAGYMEYFTMTDDLVINCHGLSIIKGNVLKSIRDNLNILLDN